MEANLPPLPELPNLDEMRKIATARIEYFTKVRDEAQDEINAAEQVLQVVNGNKPTVSTQRRWANSISDSTYRAVLEDLGNRNYAGATTMAGSAGCSTTQVRTAMKLAIERGLVIREKRGKKYRYKLTDAGFEFVCGDTQQERKNQNGTSSPEPTGVNGQS